MSKTYISDYDRYLFNRGEHYQIYKFMGAQLKTENSQQGVRFSVWAPAARRVSVVGDFNNWNKFANQMEKVGESGIWTTFIPDIKEGTIYKYSIKGLHGDTFLKSDPVALYSEKSPKTASIVTTLNKYEWKDNLWMNKRKEKEPHKEAINIYEVHAGSWKTDKEGNPYNYRRLADELIPYVEEMGYTHIELMPLTEYPFGGSWGYQTTGYFSLTSRFGKPKDFMYFVDKAHRFGLSVIMDWVPSHFCKDGHGLRLFDGTPLYESEDPKRAENKQWDTLNFDYGQPEVWSFLISSARFFFDVYHIDGLRVDAVSNMLYLDYNKEEGEWSANKYGGNENLQAVEFIKQLNQVLFKDFPGIMMVAEESTAWPMVTGSVDEGGLGFNFKWNMGWMNDILEYMKEDPLMRKGRHNLLTFSMMYAYSENYILPLSHDEVVHGKKSLLDKMAGDYWQKFANLRLLYAYMFAHPGKNLLFMGGEFGQFIEWNYKQELDWLLLDYPKHQEMKKYVKDLNHFYKRNNAFYLKDYKHEGFEWIEADDYKQSIISFTRSGKNADDLRVILCNFTPVPRENYKIGVPLEGRYKEIFNTDQEKYGGSGISNEELIKSKKEELHGFSQSIEVTVPPLAAVYLKRI
ncbi:MAG TPA: 1,4-alpha-glucan branching protein GlgB [Halanaerobiales bacterium]|nr:1,4-alpha-glucan branching protein GlgB [Halanaerobiales bacterium]